MTKFRPLLLASAAIAAFSLMAAAPVPKAHHGGFMRMMHALNLSDAQKAQMKTMVQQYRAQHPEGSPKDPQARKALREQILGILTPGQRTQLQQEMQNRKDRGRGAPGPFASPTPAPEETNQP